MIDDFNPYYLLWQPAGTFSIARSLGLEDSLQEHELASLAFNLLQSSTH